MAEKPTPGSEEEKKDQPKGTAPAEKTPAKGKKEVPKMEEKPEEKSEEKKAEEKKAEEVKIAEAEAEEKKKKDGEKKEEEKQKAGEPIDDSPYFRNRVDTTLEEDKVPKKPSGHIEREKNYAKCEEVASLVQKIRSGEWEASERSKHLEQRYGSGILRNVKAFLGGEQDYSAAINPETGTLEPDYAREVLRRVARVGVATAEAAAVMGVITLLTGGTGVAIGGALAGSALGRGIVEAYRGLSGKERAMREELEVARIRYYSKAQELADRIGPENTLPAPGETEVSSERASEYLRERNQAVKDLVNFVFASEQHGVSLERDARGWVYSRTQVTGEPHPPGEIGEAQPGGPTGRTLNTGTEVYQPSEVAPNAKTIDDMEKEFEAHRKKWDWIEIGAGAAGGILGGLASVLSAKGEIVKTLSTKLASGETIKLDIDGNGIYHGVQKAGQAMVSILDKAKEYVWHMANANEYMTAFADRSTDIVMSGQQFGSRVLGVTSAELAKAINTEAWKQVIGGTWQAAVRNCTPVIAGLIAHTIGKSLAEKGKEKHFKETRDSMKQEQEVLRRRFKPEDEIDRLKAEARRLRKPFPAPGQDWIYEEGGEWRHVRIEEIDDSDPDDILVAVRDFGTEDEYSTIELMPIDIFLRDSAKRVVVREKGDFAFPKKKETTTTATVIPGVVATPEKGGVQEEQFTVEHEPGQRIVAEELTEITPNIYRAHLDDDTSAIVVNEGRPFVSFINVNLVVDRVDNVSGGEILFAKEETDDLAVPEDHPDDEDRVDDEIKTTKTIKEQKPSEVGELTVGQKVEAVFERYSDGGSVVVKIGKVGYKLKFNDGAPIGLQDGKPYKFEVVKLDDPKNNVVTVKYLGVKSRDAEENIEENSTEKTLAERSFEKGAVWVMRPLKEGEKAPEIPYSAMKSTGEVPQERNSWHPNKNWSYYIENANFDKQYIDFRARSESSPVIRVQLESFVEIMQPNDVALFDGEEDRKKALNEVFLYAEKRLGNKALWRVHPRTTEAVPVGRMNPISSAEGLRRKAQNDISDGKEDAGKGLTAHEAQSALNSKQEISADRGLPAHEERGDEKADKSGVPAMPRLNGEIFERDLKINPTKLKRGDALRISPDRIGNYDDGSGHLKSLRDLADKEHRYEFASFEDGIVEMEVDGEDLISMPQAVFENNFVGSRDVVRRVAEESVQEAIEIGKTGKKIDEELGANILQTKIRRNRGENRPVEGQGRDEKAHADDRGAGDFADLKATETSFDQREDDNSNVVNRPETVANSLKIEKNGEEVDIKPGQTWMWMWTPSYEHPEKRMPIKLNIDVINMFSNSTASVQFKGKEPINRPIDEWEAIFESATLAKE
jgi:hypothetical protein